MAYRVSALLLTLMLLAAACGGGDGAAPDDGATPTGADTATTEPADEATDDTEEPTEGAAADEPAEDLPDEIVVAGTISQSGPFAGAVTDFDELAHNFAAMVNDEGGLDMCGQQVDLRFEFTDDASDQAQARRLYEQLAANEPALLIGPYSSPLSFAASPVAESAQIPMLMAEANSDAIYSQGFEWVFGILDSGGTWSDNMFATITQFDDPPQSIGFVVEENLSNQEIYEGAKANAEEAGMEVLVEETLGGDTQDFTPAIERLRESDPDVVYISSFEPFAVTFVRQALEQGLSPRLFHVAKYGATFVDALGEQADGVSGEHYWLPGIEGEGVEQFEGLLEETGLEVGDYPWTAIRMPVFQVIRNLFETACSVDPQTLRDTLADIETETIAGTIAFKDNGAGTLKPFPSQIQDGEFRIVGPPEQAEAEYIYPADY
jgi:branched-chain amino acid transport system substrate-binding protein